MSLKAPCRFTPYALEARLDQLLPGADAAPAKVHEAMRYAVLFRGKRFRPRLLLGVAEACGVPESARDLALRAACAIEFIHCGSLVHDDLPAFDDARERRGRPAVHVAFGEPVAVLVGTALVSRAFEVIASDPAAMTDRATDRATDRTLAMLRRLAEAIGSERGIIGGQGLEDDFDQTSSGSDAQFVDRYHALKTGALFAAAAEMGAIAASHPDAAAWGEVGAQLGRCHQIADDLDDVFGAPAELGKQVGIDQSKHRPNLVLIEGAQKARARVGALLSQARSRAEQLTPPNPLVFLRFLNGLSQHFDRASRAAP